MRAALLLVCLLGTRAANIKIDVDSKEIRDRRIAALMGGFVADAAAMPLHWIYDTDLIASILDSANATGLLIQA
jgi:hypothetical protein